MSDTSNFTSYHALMNKCNKIFSIIPLVYVGICAFYLIFNFTWMIAYSLDSLFVCIDGLIIAPSVCFLGFHGAYKKHDLSVVTAPVVLLLNLGVLLYGSKHLTGKVFSVVKLNVSMISFYVCAIVFIASCVMAYLNMKANIKYRFLEKQVGFPFFNERAEEQRVNKIRREIKDPFQDEYERHIRTASSEMDSI